MATVLVGTSDGIFSVDTGGAAGPRHLDGHDVRAVAPAGWARLWAVVDRTEIWRDEPSGGWRRVASVQDVPGGDGLEATCLADTRANDPSGILVGTSRARLLRVTAGGRTDAVTGFDGAEGRDGWYTPWGGPPDTRTISEDSQSVFVNVHVGGVLRSRDAGASWEPTIDLHADVHRVVTGSGRVYAACARGLAVSEDGGSRWRLSTDGLDATYCRAVAVCGDAVLLSASSGPSGAGAALYRTGVAATAFHRCSDGLPDRFDGNIDSLCLDALPDGSAAALATASGDVYVTADGAGSWARVASVAAAVHCVLVLP